MKKDHKISNLFTYNEFLQHLDKQGVDEPMKVFKSYLVDHPSVVLIDPKFPHNIGNTLRACSNFGVKILWITGNRYLSLITKRLPREERMKGYGDVVMIRHDRPLDFYPTYVPRVCMELGRSTQGLATFTPDEYGTAYIFGPEDGSVPSAVKRHCFLFCQIESYHCLNLAAAVNVVLYKHRENMHEYYGIEMPALREDRG